MFEEARTKALADLEAKAVARGASAIVNVRFNYQVLGTNNGMLMVAATGTAVELALSNEDQAAIAVIEQESAALFHVEIDGRERGPFSIAQSTRLGADRPLRSLCGHRK